LVLGVGVLHRDNFVLYTPDERERLVGVYSPFVGFGVDSVLFEGVSPIDAGACLRYGDLFFIFLRIHMRRQLKARLKESETRKRNS